MPRGNPSSLVPFIKGKRDRGGRQKGSVNRTTRALKIALITASEKSRHSDGSLESYCIFLADEHPTTFAHLLARLIPVQMKAKLEASIHPDDLVLDTTMSLTTMMQIFEEKIKNPDYIPLPRAPRPVIIDADDDDSDE